ncbi:hypothetical protein FKM82_030816, partial [Ascaphus truei]
MCTPNDLAVLHAIFNPSAPFGDGEGPNVGDPEGDADAEGGYPPDLLEQARDLESLGVQAAESGNAEAAVQRFSEAITLLPERASAYNNRAQALRLQGDVQS